MARSFENQVALVTGGSTGIGAAVALQLAESGARVLVTGRHEETLRAAAARHPQIQYVVADISRPANVTRSIYAVRTRFDRLDVLINNAGVLAMAPLAQASPEHVQRTLDVNVLGLIETTRQALPLLRQSKGTIVIETPLFTPDKLGISSAELEAMGAAILQQVPARRFGKPEDVAQVITFLASAAAGYVNGAQYTVAGGMEA